MPVEDCNRYSRGGEDLPKAEEIGKAIKRTDNLVCVTQPAALRHPPSIRANEIDSIDLIQLELKIKTQK